MVRWFVTVLVEMGLWGLAGIVPAGTGLQVLAGEGCT